MLATRFICARKSWHVDHRGEIRASSAAAVTGEISPPPMRGAELRDAVSRVGSGIRAPKLLNLNANTALAGVNG